MMLILHIAVALTSLVQTTYLLFSPSKIGLRLSYGLMGLTLATGTYLTISVGSHMLEACLMGVLYTSFVAFGIVRTQRTLAKLANVGQ